MTDHRDMNGIWSGRYDYVGGSEVVKFTAWLDDSGGTLSGTILEPNTFVASHDEDLAADIEGARLALDISFTKTYQPGSGAHDMALIYSGTVDKAFTLLRGTWVFLEGPLFNKGSFEMSRTSVGIERARLVSLLATADRG